MKRKNTEELFLDKLLVIFEQDMAKYPAEEQSRKWNALEERLKNEKISRKKTQRIRR